VTVVEVGRPNRQVRRRHGKTDVVDAIAAGRAVLSGEASATPKTHDGPVEALRALKTLQRSANKSRTQALNQLHALVLTAPDELRELAQRIARLDAQLKATTSRLRRLTTATAPALFARPGIGPDSASTLLITAGDNPDRLGNERSFAALLGSSPIPVNSGQKQGRYRLNCGGDRDGNSALWRIAIVRMATDPDTRAYVERRMKDGKTKSEAIRCLKRYIAREVFAALPKRPPLDSRSIASVRSLLALPHDTGDGVRARTAVAEELSLTQ
jgi:transposase